MESFDHLSFMASFVELRTSFSKNAVANDFAINERYYKLAEVFIKNILVIAMEQTFFLGNYCRPMFKAYYKCSKCEREK